jgi:serine/threonine protein phosphatase PrpC
MTFAAHIYTETDLEQPCLLSVPIGEVAVFARRCPGRETANEDSIAVLSLQPNAGVLAVADGMGGEQAGNVASALTVQALKAACEAATDPLTDLRPTVLDGIENANRDVLKLGVGAASTVAVVEVCDQRLRPYHAGDSGIFLFSQRRRLKYSAMPHSPVGHALEAGFLDEDEALTHDERHLVTNYVGTEEMRIEVGAPLEMAARDTLVVASDGLTDNLTPAEIADIICRGDLLEQTRRLVHTATERMLNPADADIPSKPDDLSLIVYRCGPVVA